MDQRIYAHIVPKTEVVLGIELQKDDIVIIVGETRVLK